LMCDNVMITAQDHIKELQIRVEWLTVNDVEILAQNRELAIDMLWVKTTLIRMEEKMGF
jgi:hypothetical protein